MRRLHTAALEVLSRRDQFDRDLASLAEVFAIGCAVSLVKIADLAQVSLGPAFWMFAGLVVVTVAQDALVDRWSVWRSISRT